MNLLYPSLIGLIERAIHSQITGYSSGIFPGNEEPWPRLGRHFSLQKEGTHDIIYPWFGIFEIASGPIIYIGFSGQSGWCQTVYEKILIAPLSPGDHYRTPYIDILRQELCFALKEQNLDWLKSAEPATKYEKLIQDFFKEVIEQVGQFLI